MSIKENALLVSVIFNFKNEERNISNLISRTKKVFDDGRLADCDLELIFVNDASTDNSVQEIVQNSAKIKTTIINMSRNFGRWPCLVAGVKNAKGDVLIYLDSDLQDPPELILQMIDRYREGFEIVHAKRTKRIGENPFKLIITNFAYRIIKFLSSVRLENNVSDYKLISKRVANHLLEFHDRDPYVRGIAVWLGFKQTYVNMRDRVGIQVNPSIHYLAKALH